MTVNLIWSLSNGGDAVSGALDHGSAGSGSASTAQEIFVRHDGGNEITDAALYIRQFTGTYSGSFFPSSDFAELLSWGDALTAAGFGGFMVNLDAVGGYPESAWATYTSKSPTGGFVFRTGVGDSSDNAVTLPTTTGVATAGIIPTGLSPNVRFKAKVAIPSNETDIGYRQWDHLLRFNYTS